MYEKTNTNGAFELGRYEGLVVGSCDGGKDTRLYENWNKKSGDLELVGVIVNGIVDSTFFNDGDIVGISEYWSKKSGDLELDV